MNEFLDNLFLSNTVRHWGFIIGGIFVVAVFKKFLSKIIAGSIHKVVRSSWTMSEREMFISHVMNPLGTFILTIISVILLHDLTFPETLKFEVYGHKTQDIFPKLGVLLTIISFTWFLLSLINYVAKIFENDAVESKAKGQDQLILFLRDLVKVFVIISGILLILQMVMNKDIRAVLQGLTIVGAALALAAKESLENLIASFIIFFDKPFYAGDTVKVSNITGKVERIGLRSTRIRTNDKTLVTIPNKQMVGSIVDNLSLRTLRRGEVSLELSEKTSAAKANKLICDIKELLTSNTVLTKHSVFLTEYTKNGAVVVAEYFTLPNSLDEFNTIKQEINIAVMKIVEAQQLELSSNANTVNIFTNENDTRSQESKDIV